MGKNPKILAKKGERFFNEPLLNARKFVEKINKLISDSPELTDKIFLHKIIACGNIVNEELDALFEIIHHCEDFIAIANAINTPTIKSKNGALVSIYNSTPNDAIFFARRINNTPPIEE